MCATFFNTPKANNYREGQLLEMFVSLSLLKASMENYPKISVVTVNYNNGEFLEETILSVIGQDYPNLEYIMIDGGSTDGSLEIIERYKDHFAYWASEPDEGQYHAIQKGFEKSTGEIMAWLNSDDKYMPHSLVSVAEIFAKYEYINWLMGTAREYTEKGALVAQIGLPWCRWSRKRYLTNDFQFIQQESSFWKRSLWEKAGSTIDVDYKLAGDMELWARFFRFEKLYTTTLVLSGFRHRKRGQRSKEMKSIYLEECRKVVKRERRKSSFGTKLSIPFLYLTRWFFGPFFFFSVPILRSPYQWVFGIPRVIYYDFYQHDYTLERKFNYHPPAMLGKRQVHRKMFVQK